MRRFTVTAREYRAAVLALARLWQEEIQYRPSKLGRAAEAVKLARWALGR